MTYLPDLSTCSTKVVKQWFITRKRLISNYTRIYNVKLKIDPKGDEYRAYLWSKINEFHLQAHHAHKELCKREAATATKKGTA